MSGEALSKSKAIAADRNAARDFLRELSSRFRFWEVQRQEVRS